MKYSPNFQCIIVLLLIILNTPPVFSQENSISQLQLTSNSSFYGDQMMFTIGEPFVQLNKSEKGQLQEGFLQNTLIKSNHLLEISEVVSHNFLKKEMIRVYPIPATKEIRISWIQKEPFESMQVQIYNVQGQLKHEEILFNINSTLNISELPSGIYFLKNNNQFVSKIIKL